MAIVQFTVGIQDGVGKQGTTRFYANIPTGATVLQMEAGVTPMLALLNGVTAGKITYVKAHVPVDISGLTPNTPGSGVYVRSCGVLSFPNAVDAHPWDFVVPGILASLVSGDSLVQTEGGAVDLLTDVLGAAFDVAGTGDGTYTDEDGSALALEPRGFHTFRKFGRNVKASRGSRGV